MPAKTHEITLKSYAALNQTTVESIRTMVNANHEKVHGLRLKTAYDFSDALHFELARQMSDNNGLPMEEASRVLVFTNAISEFETSKTKIDGDFWVAVLSSRNTVDGKRSPLPITSFGDREFWSELHFTGSLSSVIADISEWIANDKVTYPNSDPARIVIANVSTAARRLSKRAAALGIAIRDNNFAS